MTLKEKFLEIKTYDEFNKRREEFWSLDYTDIEIKNHYSKIFGKSNIRDHYPDFDREGLHIDFFDKYEKK